MKNHLILNSLVSFILVSGIFFSCSSAPKEEQEPYVQPDYSEDDIRNAEIERIKKLLETDSLAALWRTILLEQKTDSVLDLHDVCLEKVKEDYKTAISSKDYVSARKIKVSLDGAGIESGELSSSELSSLIFSQVPPLSGSDTGSLYDGKMSSLIEGTVTIFVDKGLKIENGVGHADGIIGSGFFIDKNGTIVTNHHVISDVVDPKNEKYSRLFVRLAQDPDNKIPAKVIGYDEVLDLALLKAEIDSPYVFNLGSSTDLEVGDRIYAIGSPIGLERTLTSGIVSATDRKLFTIGSVLQIDASVNSGNSGGPLVDQKGRVQGIIFAGMIKFSGLNFVIPVEYLKNELAYLYKGGKLEHGWIGAFGKSRRQGGKNTGLELQYVMPGSSSSRAGLKAGDVITAVNGKSINSLEDMQNALMQEVPGTLLKLSCENEDKKFSTLVYLSVRPKNPGYSVYQSDLLGNAFEPLFGMKLISVASNGRKYAIESILKGSSADISSFSVNDPVDIKKIEFDDEKTSVYAEISTKKRKLGYLDFNIGITAALDSPYYF